MPGNAFSITQNLPSLSPVLRMLGGRSQDFGPVRYTLVCCSYRGTGHHEDYPRIVSSKIQQLL